MTLDKNEIKDMIRKAGQLSADYIKLTRAIMNSLDLTVEEEHKRVMEDLQHREEIILDALANILKKCKREHLTMDEIKNLILLSGNLGDIIKEEINCSETIDKFQHREEIILDALSNILKNCEREHLTLDEIKNLILLSINLGDIIKEEINSAETLNKFREMEESDAKMKLFPII